MNETSCKLHLAPHRALITTLSPAAKSWTEHSVQDSCWGLHSGPQGNLVLTADVLGVRPVIFFEPGLRRGDLGLMQWHKAAHRAATVIHQQRVMDSVPSIPTLDVLK